MRSFLVPAAHLFLGAQCAVCHAPAWGACDRCATAVSGQVPFLVERPGLELGTVAANDYRPQMEKLIPAFKDDGALHLRGLLGARLATAVAMLEPPGDACLVPVPSLPSAVRRRGHDHTASLAACAARHLGLRWRRLIRRRPSGLDQRDLGAPGRRRNMTGSMQAKRWGAPVVIVDDVCTTGATLVEALRSLAAAGVPVLGAAVVADADRRRNQPSPAFHPADQPS